MASLISLATPEPGSVLLMGVCSICVSWLRSSSASRVHSMSKIFASSFADLVPGTADHNHMRSACKSYIKTILAGTLSGLRPSKSMFNHRSAEHGTECSAWAHVVWLRLQKPWQERQGKEPASLGAPACPSSKCQIFLEPCLCAPYHTGVQYTVPRAQQNQGGETLRSAYSLTLSGAKL